MIDFISHKINKKNIIEFSIVLIISILIFTPFLIGHYATDTYNIANVGYENYAIKWSLNIFIYNIISSINNFINVSNIHKKHN